MDELEVVLSSPEHIIRALAFHQDESWTQASIDRALERIDKASLMGLAFDNRMSVYITKNFMVNGYKARWVRQRLYRILEAIEAIPNPHV